MKPQTNTGSDTPDSKTDHDHGKERRTVGLLTSPGLGERLARDISETLPGSLSEGLSDEVEWHVEVTPDPLTGSNVSVDDILEEISRKQSTYGWDYAIAMTDLPIRHDNRIVIARTGRSMDIGVISIPPLGVIRVHARTRDMVLELMDDLFRGTLAEDSPTRFMKGSNANRDHTKDEDGSPAALNYTAPPVRGHLKLLAGMVYANRPWQLFPSFKTTVATAFATGGYGLIFTSLWEIGNVYGYARQITLMVAAMSILVTWIILSHKLWERPRAGVSRYVRNLYNASTVLTIASGVVFYYVIIFILLLLAAAIYIPARMLESTIGQDVAPINYIRIAWVTSSVATIAGAIGAGLEDTDAVRQATFGWRQSLRWEDYENNVEDERPDDKSRD